MKIAIIPRAEFDGLQPLEYKTKMDEILEKQGFDLKKKIVYADGMNVKAYVCLQDDNLQGETVNPKVN